jgi:hypothetical protein
VNLESQLRSVQEELNSAKLVIELLLKDIDSLGGDLDKRDTRNFSYIRNDKFPVPLEMDKDKNKSFSHASLTDSRHIPAIINQCKQLKKWSRI